MESALSVLKYRAEFWHFQLLHWSLLSMESCLYRPKYLYSKGISKLVHDSKKNVTFFKRSTTIPFLHPPFVFLQFFFLFPVHFSQTASCRNCFQHRFQNTGLMCFGTHFSRGRKTVSNIFYLLNLPFDQLSLNGKPSDCFLFLRWCVSGFHHISIIHDEYLIGEM